MAPIGRNGFNVNESVWVIFRRGEDVSQHVLHRRRGASEAAGLQRAEGGPGPGHVRLVVAGGVALEAPLQAELRQLPGDAEGGPGHHAGLWQAHGAQDAQPGEYK